MNIERKFYLPAVTCVAAVMSLGLGWFQYQQSDSDRAQIVPSILDTGKIRELSFDSPIDPIFLDDDLNQEKVALGDALFHDPRLSSTNSVSCASCHDLNTGGVDGLAGSIGVNGGVGNTNSPTLFNISLNIAQFWDGRAETLDDQIDGPIHDPVELGSGWPEIIDKLNSDTSYSNKFDELYPDGITELNIKDAITTFEQSLVTINSPFDRFLQGDLNAVSENVKKGCQKFKEFGCVACHQGKNVGGNMYQPLGIMGDYFGDRGTPITQADLGRFNVTGREEDKFVFRVPSLRLVALTAPYFHDGSATTLKDAVKIMFKYQIGRTATEEDVALIIEFLNSLIGEYKGKGLAL